MTGGIVGFVVGGGGVMPGAAGGCEGAPPGFALGVGDVGSGFGFDAAPAAPDCVPEGTAALPAAPELGFDGVFTTVLLPVLSPGSESALLHPKRVIDAASATAT